MSGQFCSILIKGTVKSSYIVLIAYCSHRIHDVGAVRKEAKKIEFVFFFLVFCWGQFTQGTYNWTNTKILAICLETLASPSLPDHVLMR